jgi:transcriptional regulator with XRE-family HTH domain
MSKDLTASLKKGIIERITARLEAIGYNPQQACREAGLHPDTIRNMRRDDKTGKNLPRLDTLAQLAPVLGVSSAWLAYGDGPTSIVDSRMLVIPITQRFQAGVWIEKEQPPSGMPPAIIPRRDDLSGDSVYAGKVEGLSMDRVFPDGTVVVLERILPMSSQVIDRNIYHIALQNPAGHIENTLKRAMLDETGKFWFAPESSSPRFSAAVPAANSRGYTISIVGRVIEGQVRY